MELDSKLSGTATTFVKPPLLSPGGGNRENKKVKTFLTLQEVHRIRTTDIGCYYQKQFKFEVPVDQLDQEKSTEGMGEIRKSVNQAQLKLPPSYEKDSIPSTAPNIALVSYCIIAKVWRFVTLEPLAETSRAIRIVPVVKEELPLQTSSVPGKENTATASAYVEGKAWTGSQGKMEMEVAQPKSLCVPVSTGYDTCQKEYVATWAEMKMRFEPTEVNGIPPKLTRVTAKLRAATRVSNHSTIDRPYHIGTRADGTDDGLSVETIPLVGGTVQEVKWHVDLSGHNKDTVSSDKARGERYLRTILPLRLVLPLKKMYLPTFHSSRISHFYVLVLILKYQMHGDSASPKKDSMRLEVPIQVSSEPFVNENSHFSDDSDGDGD